MLKYKEISEGNNLSLEALSGFLISLNETNRVPLWFEFIQNKIIRPGYVSSLSKVNDYVPLSERI